MATEEPARLRQYAKKRDLKIMIPTNVLNDMNVPQFKQSGRHDLEPV